MTYEEMAARAAQMRARDLYGQVTEEEAMQWPAVQTEHWIDTENGKKVHIYQISKVESAQNNPMIINFHGGGFIKGRQNKDRLFCSKLATIFSCLVWDVDYSLAPEAPYPTALEECYGIVSYVFDHAEELGVDKRRIILTGHSAGGNLAAGVCLMSGKEGRYLPAGLAIEFFPADLYTDPALKPRAEGDMPAEVAKTYNAFYCGPERAKDPCASPIFAEPEQLAVFPETLIISGGLDSLCFEDEEFAMKLSQAGVTVTSRRFCHSHHGFTINRTDEWEAATNLIFDFIKRKVEI